MSKIFIFCLLFSQIVNAQLAMKKGDSAPYDGIFLSNAEAAKAISEIDYQKKKCELEKDYGQREISILKDVEIKALKQDLNYINEKNKQFLLLKDKEIDRLYKIMDKNGSSTYHWWFAGGAAVGIVTSVVIFFAATQISQTDALIQK